MLTTFSIQYGTGSPVVQLYLASSTRGFAMEEEVESLPEALCYKQRLEKSTGAEIFLAKWSPVADLLAAACTDHSVSSKITTSCTTNQLILLEQCNCVVMY